MILKKDLISKKLLSIKIETKIMDVIKAKDSGMMPKVEFSNGVPVNSKILAVIKTKITRMEPKENTSASAARSRKYDIDEFG